MPRSAFRRRGARMREYAAGAANTTDDSADGNGDGAAPAPFPPPPGLGMPFSRRGRRGRRGRQAAGETGSVIPKLLMKMVVYGVVMVAMKYGKKQGKDDASTSPGSPGDIVSRITFLFNDVQLTMGLIIGQPMFTLSLIFWRTMSLPVGGRAWHTNWNAQESFQFQAAIHCQLRFPRLWRVQISKGNCVRLV